MNLVRDLLDVRVVDRHGRDMGRVDAVVLAMPRGRAPYVVALEIGPSVLAGRLSRLCGRIVEGLEHACGVDEGRPFRLPMSAVLSIGDVVKVDLNFADTPAAAVEKKLRGWLRRVPYGSRSSKA